MQLYQNESSNPKYNAQRNLIGRTHYVDDDTLRFHKARIISSADSCNGLVFWLIESTAMDYQNTTRGFRYVIFDVFGNVIDRPELGEGFRTSNQARKAMYKALTNINPYKVTATGIKNRMAGFKAEIDGLKTQLQSLKQKSA